MSALENIFPRQFRSKYRKRFHRHYLQFILIMRKSIYNEEEKIFMMMGEWRRKKFQLKITLLVGWKILRERKHSNGNLAYMLIRI